MEKKVINLTKYLKIFFILICISIFSIGNYYLFFVDPAIWTGYSVDYYGDFVDPMSRWVEPTMQKPYVIIVNFVVVLSTIADIIILIALIDALITLIITIIAVICSKLDERYIFK